MRDHYESQEDRDRQEIVVKIFEKIYGITYHQLPESYRLDGVFCRGGGKVTAFVEIKCRTIPYQKYPTLKLSASKWITGVQFHQDTGANFLIIVQWTDRFGYYNYSPKTKIEIEWGGRNVQTRDAADTNRVFSFQSMNLR